MNDDDLSSVAKGLSDLVTLQALQLDLELARHGLAMDDEHRERFRDALSRFLPSGFEWEPAVVECLERYREITGASPTPLGFVFWLRHGADHEEGPDAWLRDHAKLADEAL